MQLSPPNRFTSVRARLGAAAGTLLALGGPALARADSNPMWQLDASGLYYGEKNRTTVIEPIVRVTRLLAGGQTLSARLGFDAITGASPTGAIPTGRIQTITTASGRTSSTSATDVPTSPFNDHRVALDVDWERPIGGLFKVSTGGHVSKERDYRSLGGNATFSLDVMHRLTTLSAGVSYNRDSVDPVGGTPVGLSDGKTFLTLFPDPKRVAGGTIGVSRILTRRLMLSLDGSRTYEHGYLTEPYKVLSLVDGTTGTSTGEITEKRPDRRNRTDILASGVYHLTSDVLYASYRHYWDDWGVRSNTIDFRFRHELLDGKYLQPHVRLYRQTAASFFVFDLPAQAARPDFATSDYRLGPLSTATIGLKYGFPVPDGPGELYIRGEYMRQFGNGRFSTLATAGSPGGDGERQAGGVNLFPPVDVTTILVGYTVEF